MPEQSVTQTENRVGTDYTSAHGGPQGDSSRVSWSTAQRLSLYVVMVTVVLMLLATAAAVAVGLLWTASLEPVSDGERVLELMRQGDAGQGR